MTTTKSRGTIEALMTRNPVAVTGATTASELAVILDENEISGVPVVDPGDREIGVVSRTDLLHQCVEGPPGARPGTFLTSIGEGLGGAFDTETLGVVADFMNPDPITVTADEAVSTVASRMLEERAHRVIVVDAGGQLRGIVTSLDMLKLIVS